MPRYTQPRGPRVAYLTLIRFSCSPFAISGAYSYCVHPGCQHCVCARLTSLAYFCALGCFRSSGTNSIKSPRQGYPGKGVQRCSFSSECLPILPRVEMGPSQYPSRTRRLTGSPLPIPEKVVPSAYKSVSLKCESTSWPQSW